LTATTLFPTPPFPLVMVSVVEVRFIMNGGVDSDRLE
jgi:hypothetical protein